MAKKSAASAEPAPHEGDPKGQISIISLKGTAEFRAWLVAQSKRTHIPAATIVRLGLAAWAEKNGAPLPPEK